MVAKPAEATTPAAPTGARHDVVALIAKPGGPDTGVGRYVQMLHQGLCTAGINAVRIAPSVPPLPTRAYQLIKWLGADVQTFLLNYPLWAAYPPAEVYHLTSQNLASLLLFRHPPGRVVITVHDIIPYMLRNDPQLCTYRTFADRMFDGLAMLGLRRADHLIADSHYTRHCVVKRLGIASERVSVVHLGIDHERFRPQAVPEAIYARYGLRRDRCYLIYVGSEDPRKNLVTLLQALARVRAARYDVELIKVGRAHFAAERRKLSDLAAQLGVGHAIHWLDNVSEEDLPLLYNLADVCVMPSLYEGFGFPVLEAMACGTPVVCARAASLPELVGGAAQLVSPHDAVGLAEAILATLAIRHRLTLDMIEQSQRFSWQQTAADVLRIYHDLV